MRVIKERLARRDEERGAVAVIVALCMIAIFAMVVLTVDVGGLLLERRSMVNAADAAALAAAQSCANTDDTTDPEDQADAFAKDNVTDLPADGIDNITEIVGCDTGSGHVSVRYSEQHKLFFAAILPGQDNQGTIATVATASWGPLAGGFAIPIVLDAGYIQGTCKVPDGIEMGDTCAFWYNNTDSLASGNWGYMNLDLWNVAPGQNCSNAGTSDRSDWVHDGYPDLRILNGDPPGTAPTYVCNDTGHSSANWQDLKDTEGEVKFFPVNDCAGQISKTGAPAPCPATPDKYDIIGFTSLLVQHVYKGNDHAASGTFGLVGNCATKNSNPKNWATNQTLDLDSITSATNGWQGCSATATDTATLSNVVIKAQGGGGAVYTQCPPVGGSNCAYRFDPATHQITWVSVPTNNTDVSFHWAFADTPGACGNHPSDPNAICLVTEWRGFTTGPGPVGGGDAFGPSGIVLCDLDYSVGCPDQG
jgi:Flp pilus assembly protein TadG